MYTIEIVYPNTSTNRVNMNDYDAAIDVANNIFRHSAVPPVLVQVWDFGVNNDQNQIVLELRRNMETLTAAFEELEPRS